MEELISSNPLNTQTPQSANLDLNPSRKTIFKSKKFWGFIIICISISAFILFPIFYVGINIYKNMMGQEPLNTFTLPTTASNSSSDLTKDWKTYENPLYGYALKYPQEWIEEYRCLDRSKATDECTLSEIIIKSYPYKEIEQSVPEDANGLIVMIKNVSNPKGLSVKNYASSVYNSNEFGSSYPISEETIGPNTFIKADISDKGLHTPNYYIEDPNGNILEISGTVTAKNFDYEKMPASEYNNYLETFNKILSTFIFTN